MNVRLISLTQPYAKDIQHLTPEELIIYEARVSNPDNQLKMLTGPKLIQYLLKPSTGGPPHVSPFQMVDMTVEVECALDIAPQVWRHQASDFMDKPMDVQQFSMRYSEASLGYEIRKGRRQHPKTRQASVDDLSEETGHWFEQAQIDVLRVAQALYEEALKRGIAKECARALLPNMMSTRFYMKNSVRNWMFYLLNRLHWTAQAEHREVAQGIRMIFAEQFPVIDEACFGKDGILLKLED